ncbi:MAG: right-handed parallel beta-helix repeat-containing protein [Prevotella sp.]
MRKKLLTLATAWLLTLTGVLAVHAKDNNQEFVSLAYVWLHHLKMDKLTPAEVEPMLNRYNWNGISDVALIGGVFMAGQDATLVTAWNRDTWPPVAVGKDYKEDPIDEQAKRDRLCSKEVIKTVIRYFKRKHIKIRLCETGYGWLTGGSLSAVVKDKEKTLVYAKRLGNLAKELGCNGVDFDWEFPPTAEEAEGYRLLMKEVKRQGLKVSVCAIQPTVDKQYMDNCFPDDAAVNNHVGKHMKWERIVKEGIVDEINVMQYLAYNPKTHQMDVDVKFEKMGIWEKAFPNEFTDSRNVKIMCGVGYYSFMLPEAKVGKKIKGKGTQNFTALYQNFGSAAYANRIIGNEHTVWTTRNVREIVRHAKAKGWGGVFTWVVSHDFTLEHPIEYNRQQALAEEVEKIWNERHNQQIHVSPNGNDKQAGTFSRPLRTLQAALAKARKVNPKYEVEILLHEGSYEITSTLVINRNRTTIKAYGNDAVSVSGGRYIAPAHLKPVTHPAILQRLQPQVRNRVREIDFRQLHLPLKGLHAVGFGRPSFPAWTEPFASGCTMQPARWPNDSTQLIGRIVESGAPKDKDEHTPHAVFGYDSQRPSAWKDTRDMWIAGYFAHGYADDMVNVARIDSLQKLIYTGQHTVYGFMTGAPFRRWYALNLLEELDLDGEYVIDSEQQKMYLLLPAGTEKTGIHLSVLETPLFAIENCKDVTIEGLALEYGRGIGIYMERTHHVTVNRCTLRNLGGTAIVMGKGTLKLNNNNSMESGGAPVSRMLGDVMGTIYENTLFNREAGTDNCIRNCHIYNVGAGGISMGGGDRKTLMPAGNRVENCNIHDFNRIEKSYRPGIWIDGVGNSVSKCAIYNAPSMAILFHGNNHLIELCDIHHVCNEIDDQGAIYYGRDPSELGNTIRWCYFHDFNKDYRTSSTYHDDGACGTLVYGNIYQRAGASGALIGGGHHNRYVNNIFMDMPQAIHIDARMTNWGKFMIERNAVIDKRLKAVDYQQPPYSKAYPWLSSYWEKSPAVPHDNVIEGNLFYRIKNNIHGNTEWLEMYNNWSTTKDPGFVDPSHPLKGFKDDAAVYKRIQGFAKIPMDEIGYKLPENLENKGKQ